jgi:hypothetical protein
LEQIRLWLRLSLVAVRVRNSVSVSEPSDTNSGSNAEHVGQ